MLTVDPYKGSRILPIRKAHTRVRLWDTRDSRVMVLKRSREHLDRVIDFSMIPNGTVIRLRVKLFPIV